MTQNGQVISINGQEAVVRVIRTSACEGCKQKNLCAGVSGGCAEGKPLDVTVKNTAGAKVGDNVVLSSGAGFVLGAAFCIFTAPIIIAIAAYFISCRFFESVSACYIASAVSFAISLCAFCFGFNKYTKTHQPVEISQIIS